MTTRIAIIADSHFDEHSRFEETVRIHTWIARDMAERGVDLVLHGGDLYERKSTPRERLAAAAWLTSVAELRPVVIVRGNHDAVGDLALLGKLDTRHPIIVEEGAAVHVVAGVAVGCLAWPRRSELLAQAESHASAEDEARRALQNVVRGLGAEMCAAAAMDYGVPRVLLAHAMVRGSVTSTGQPLVGCDMELGIEDLDLASADLVALGHIHKAQEWDISTVTGLSRPVVYPGSPRRSNFGELEAKGYVIATFDGSRLVSVERVETPATPMIHIEASLQFLGAEWLAWAEDAPTDEAVRGAEVRLRYRVDADLREQGRLCAAARHQQLLRAGAASVQVEEVVIPTTRARAPEVAAAPGLAEKLSAYWEARGTTPTEDRARELVRKATSLETAA